METNPLCDEIYQTLEREIVSLKIKPGEVLSENSLCKRFSVSRTPIRSVLQHLQQNRFVTIVPHKGTIVTAIDLNIVNQFIYQRVAVETMVLRDFVRSLSPTDIVRCRYTYSLMQQACHDTSDPEQFDINDFLQKDLQMHEIWFQATRKMYLWENLTRPQSDYSRFIRLDIVGARNVPDVLKEHQEMMDIIESGNTNGIEELMSAHLYGGIRRLGSQIFTKEYEQFFTPVQ